MMRRAYPRAIARGLLAGLLLVGLAGAIATLALHLWAQWHDGPYRVSSLTHTMPEGDYSLLWSAGRMAASGQGAEVYDGPKLLIGREALFGPGWSRLDWMYPPPMLALGMAVSAIPLLPGYAMWLLLMCAASIWALRGAGLSWRVVLFGLFGPPTWLCLALGQYAPLAASFVVAGLLQARRSPIRAGLQVALATLKPHLGVLVPVVWLAQRRWKAFAAAGVGTLVLAGASTALLGIGIWPAFLHGIGVSGSMLLAGYFRNGYPLWAASVFWMARSFGASIALGYAAQVLAAFAVVGAVWFAARRGSARAAAAVAACMMPLVSPYLYTFDLVGYSIVVAMLAEQRGFDALPIVLWLCPGVSELFAYTTGMAVLPVCVVLVAVLAWREFDGRLPAGDAAAARTEPAAPPPSLRSAV